MNLTLYEQEVSNFYSRTKEQNEKLMLFKKHLDKIFSFLSNQKTEDEEIKFLTLKDLHNYLIVMRLSLNCILNGSYLTKREIFYLNQNIFLKQETLNLVIKQFSYDIQICRKELHFVSASKGLVCGALILRKNDFEVDLLSLTFQGKGLNITEFMDEWIPIVYGQVILIVEKETIYFHLINEKNIDFFQNVVLITGKGYPCNATKYFIKYLSIKNPQIPVYYFGDYDPHGYDILIQYSFGNILNQHEYINIPWIQWLNYIIQQDEMKIKQKQKLQQRELLLLKALLSNKNIPTEWKDVMNTLEKFEIEDIITESFSSFLVRKMINIKYDII